ncbi:HTH domain-containing protein [Clostridium bovifaecis]|uniref:HTH domain-containing protein n=1 Tax=Clostridium bovifaecis TaxID=2184719 RepID=A0A6I6F090_9CLOT|nr:HTH domain-containing protein [Clostridium bovifaecis]
MNSKLRRDYIKKLLNSAIEPKKGQELAEELGVTRQVIVKDIAILRASGINIIATPEGYVVPRNEKNSIEKIVALSHGREKIADELETIIKYGGIVKDVIVEHPLYGEIKAMLMIKTLYDIQKFIKKIDEYDAEPLLSLTRGIHLHTIEVEKDTDMDKIIEELKYKGYLVE